MLAFIGNLAPLEIVVIAVIAILVFGKRLPEVAGRFLYHIRRLRQSMYDLRRESGIDQEIRNVERSVRQAAWEAEARAAREVEAEEAEEVEEAEAVEALPEKTLELEEPSAETETETEADGESETSRSPAST